MAEVTILDGGLATELERMGYNAESDPLFGSSLLYTKPAAIAEVHDSYLRNGAEIVTTATYQASIETLCKYLDLKEVGAAKELIKSAVWIAQQSCEEFWRSLNSDVKHVHGKMKPRVAGSVGPYGACLRDGSEYDGHYVDDMTEEELKSWHRPRIQALVEAGTDLIAMETIPAIKEGMALVQLLKEYPSTKAWLSFSCKDDKTISKGEAFADVVHQCLALDSAHQLIAIGINCTKPHHIAGLLNSAQNKRTSVEFVVYPNSGDIWDANKGWIFQEKHLPLHELAPSWVELGARYIGGCCRISPTDINLLAHKLQAISHFHQSNE